MSVRGKTLAARLRIIPILALALSMGVAAVPVAPGPAMAVVTGQPVTTAFPRLAMWWPNNDTQSAASRARYDFVGLQNHDANHIAELRAANPSIMVLGSTNARELNYRLGSYNDALNVELRSASTDWMLTQAGSVLTAGITNSATTIPVADSTRFAAGELALVDHELVYINSVAAGSLNVTRGQVNPAASHASGVRIASVVSVWDGAIEFDLTASSPRVDVGAGPETWAEWNTRRAHNVVHSADWDGVIIDCYDPNPAWWVTLGQNRSIDANRDNVADNLDSFTTAWNAGLTAYGNTMRSVLGPDEIILTNGKGRNFSLNGSNFETFPTATTSLSIWNRVVMGPYVAPHASYLEFSQYAAQPNLSFIETFGTQADYQFMRYGLTTALMADGYFSYVSSAGGHGSGGLWWYDEYDNAGQGRGYLGQPTGAAFSAGSNVVRRDYQGGIVLVNPDAVAHTISLGGTFRKIKGTQAPSVNDGSLVTQVTLQPRDGIVLLRETGTVTPPPAPAPTDVTPPTTTLLAGTSAPARWYNAPVTLTEQASDAGSGVQAVYLDRGAGTESVASGTQFALSSEGDKVVKYWATDKAGNTEPVHTANIGIDLSAPTVSSDAKTEPYAGTAVVNLSAADGLSGAGTYEYKVDGGAAQTGRTVTLTPTTYPATYQLSFRASDVAGNWSAWSAAQTISVSKPAHVPVYRFFNVKNATHFYTASAVERDNVIANLGQTYQYEGITYYVSQNAAEGKPVFRFYNGKVGVHFYTASESERDNIIATMANTYTYEGIAYYASLTQTNATPVYRFFNSKTRTHFYTASESERDNVRTVLGKTYHFEGTAYYAWSQ